jgi:hypothetical protein
MQTIFNLTVRPDRHQGRGTLSALPRAGYLAWTGGFDMPKKRFVCAWVNTWREIIERKVFTLAEAGVLLTLQSYIQYRNNTIRDPTTGMPMTKKQIAEVLGKSVAQTDRLLEGLIYKVALIESKQGRRNGYILNPCLFWKGTEKDREYIDTYRSFLEIKNIRLQENPEKLIAVRVNGISIPLIYERLTTQK